jgi:hypothetical protein
LATCRFSVPNCVASSSCSALAKDGILGRRQNLSRYILSKLGFRLGQPERLERRHLQRVQADVLAGAMDEPELVLPAERIEPLQQVLDRASYLPGLQPGWLRRVLDHARRRRLAALRPLDLPLDEQALVRLALQLLGRIVIEVDLLTDRRRCFLDALLHGGLAQAELVSQLRRRRFPPAPAPACRFRPLRRARSGGTGCGGEHRRRCGPRGRLGASLYLADLPSKYLDCMRT